MRVLAFSQLSAVSLVAAGWVLSAPVWADGAAAAGPVATAAAGQDARAGDESGNNPAGGNAPGDNASSAGENAVWTRKEAEFTYLGFTTTYSCDGLHDKVKKVLLDLGARKQDLKVSSYGCTALFGRPEKFPGVRVKMSVLEPASQLADDKKGNATPVAAHWRPLDLKLERFADYNPSGECELMEQIKAKIVPLFSTRNVQFNDNCIPFQATPTSPVMQLEVLSPDTASAASNGK